MQQQQQQPGQPMGSVPPTNITTEQIQKYLDENKQLILAILDNQNLGRLAECAQYQAQLQKNLLYLAAIADAQPQSPAMRPQMIPHAAMPQAGGAQYVHQPGPVFPPRAPLQFTPQQVQELQQQQQLHHQPHMMPFPGHVGMRPVGVLNGSNEAQSEAQCGSTPSGSIDGRGSKQGAGGAASENVVDDSSKRKSLGELGSGDADHSGNSKRPKETKAP